MVLPVGAPAWTGTASAENYGGHADKRNYQSIGRVNAQTDFTAEELQRIAADLAAVVRLSPFARMRVRCNAAGVDPTVYFYADMAGSEAPIFTPDAVTVGLLTIEWPTTAQDAFGVEAPIGIVAAFTSTPEDGFNAQPTVVSGTVVDIALTDGGVAAQGEFLLEVWTG